MQNIIRPIAIWFGIRNAGKQARFVEQFYTAIYFAVFGPFGLWVMSRTPVWYFNTAGMYEGFPHRAHESYFKVYYLLQAAYWAQQAIVLVLMLEKPRKDFKELVLHHIVTLALIFLSYRFHFTYMGIAVYITHDISDFFLAVSPTTPYYTPLTSVVRQSAELHQLANHTSILRLLHWRMGVHAPLSQPPHLIFNPPRQRVRDGRSFRSLMARAAIQVLAQSSHHFPVIGHPANGEHLLVLPDNANHGKDLDQGRVKGRT